MQFSETEISLARELRDSGLQWQPAVGHYVYDEAGLIDAPSPFQPRVYFILDMKHFLRRSESVQGLTRAMFWLPQWHQARELLADAGVAEDELAAVLAQRGVLSQRGELAALYRRLLQVLRAK